MASQGPLSPGTVLTGFSTALGYGSNFTNPNNIKVSDNTYADSPTEIGTSIQAGNFGFSIPSGSTIDGIVIEFEKKATYSASNVSESVVKLVKANGSVGTTNKAAGGYWSLTESYVSYGSSSDLWGDTWTAEDINDADFGVVMNMYAYDDVGKIDHVRCTVYYTAGSSAVVKTSNGLALASVKTFNGLALASTKTKNGAATV
jgi:hypothetical protein